MKVLKPQISKSDGVRERLALVSTADGLSRRPVASACRVDLSRRPVASKRSADGSAAQTEAQRRRKRSQDGSRTKADGTWNLEFGTCARQGVALVITLIMLAIITFMAVTFLVLSQRERGSVNTALDQKTAQMAADTAFNRVCAELLTDALLNTNTQVYSGIKVSTNYINYAGFNNGLLVSYPTNVNYDYLVSPNPAAPNPPYPANSPQYRNQNISDLEFNPRPPVFVVTNTGTGSNEFRFYLDLNRNGRFDTNVLAPVLSSDPTSPTGLDYTTTNALGQFINVPTVPQPGWILSNYFGGDPEWIGVLENPWELHSADNKFTSRYAYMVIPVGNTLDLNTVGNEARPSQSVAPGAFDSFVRNQGTGPWELNLAAFLADLNTNIWFTNSLGLQYQYGETNQNDFNNSGLAFTHARGLLNYRYGGSPNNPTNFYSTLYPANLLFPKNAVALQNGADWYSAGDPLMLYTTNVNELNQVTLPWAGAPNTNHFSDLTADLFDTTKTPPGFAAALMNVGTSNDTYNSSTFYRLLSQMGTDSAPEKGKLNVNWKNTDSSGNIIPGKETNLIAWTPADFFTNAAQRMFQQLNLRDLNNNLITVTNIPIYENPLRYNGTNINYYTPAVHRILQLAANIYDATASRYIGGGPTNYPSVFRPIFINRNGMACIVGYMEVTNTLTDNSAFLTFFSPSNFVAQAPQNLVISSINMDGVPWVIGAKKGFPNFNEMSMNNPLSVQRVIMFTNQPGKTTGPPWNTNQMYQFAISNNFGIEAWNSYTNAYLRPLRLTVSNYLSIQVSNQFGNVFVNVKNLPFGNVTNFLTGWPGWNGNPNLPDASFHVPLLTNIVFTNGIYLPYPPYIVPLAPPQWAATTVPHLYMGLSFRLQFVLIDTYANRVIDFVNINDTEPQIDIDAVLSQGVPVNGLRDQNTENEMWETNLYSGVSEAVLNQIDVGEGYVSGYQNWTDINKSKEEQIFRDRLNNSLTNSFQDPYVAQAAVWQMISWQANDPLVHYTALDMTGKTALMATYNSVTNQYSGQSPPTAASLPNLGKLNLAYQPWGGYPGNPNNPKFDLNYQVKDPAMFQSDNWDFPTNSLPGIGWLGRVHRGTPWQTIYLKPFTGGGQNWYWTNWVNDSFAYGNGNAVILDGLISQPNQDGQLFDLFTAAVNESAASGHLNVNQSGLAAWSAALSGVSVLTNTPAGGLIPMPISPAGVYSNNILTATPLAKMWMGIQNTRTNTNPNLGPVFLNNEFQHVGDVLNTPQLTVASPFLNTNSLSARNTEGINDEVLERIPQQVMSLLTLNPSPRFVIYSFGQTLHPANNSLVTGGTFNGLCTNYQITAESVTRAVVRVDGSPDPQYTTNYPPHPDPYGRFYPPHIVVEQFNVLAPE